MTDVEKLKDNYLIVAAICVALLGAVISFTLGIRWGESNVRQEAVLLGHAEYVCPPWLNPQNVNSINYEFRWRISGTCGVKIREAQ